MIKQREFFKETSCDLIHYYLYEPIASKMGDYLAKKKVTPNEVTILRGIIILFVAFLLFYYKGQINCVLFGGMITFLLVLSWILDDVDGYMARKYNMKSKLGAWLDSIIDIIGGIVLLVITFLNVDLKLIIILALLVMVGIAVGILARKKIRKANKCEPKLLNILTHYNVLFIIPVLFIIKLKGS